jgi:hypothetical protein
VTSVSSPISDSTESIVLKLFQLGQDHTAAIRSLTETVNRLEATMRSNEASKGEPRIVRGPTLSGGLSTADSVTYKGMIADMVRPQHRLRVSDNTTIIYHSIHMCQ